MAEDKFILVGLDDSRAKDIADVLGNKTCKKILDYLAEIKEASEKDIADKLAVPINTIEYNLNKLVRAGLIELTKNFFWSVKGKKINMYRLSNKKIVISPKTFAKGIVPALIGIGLLSLGIKLYEINNINNSFSSNKASVSSVASGVLDSIASEKVNAVNRYVPQVRNVCSNAPVEIWLWFLLGGLTAILILLLWNSYKKMKGGF